MEESYPHECGIMCFEKKKIILKIEKWFVI